MKTGTKLLLAGGAVTALAGMAYYNNAKALQFTVAGLSVDAQLRLKVRIQVYNPSRLFSYPVPALQAALFDSNETLLGWLSNPVWQIIRPGISFIDGIFIPDQNSFFSTLTGYALQQSLPAHINIQGEIMAWGHRVPFSTTVTVRGLAQ